MVTSSLLLHDVDDVITRWEQLCSSLIIVITVDAMHQPVEFFRLHAGIADYTFIMEDNGVKILFYNLRNRYN